MPSVAEDGTASILSIELPLNQPSRDVILSGIIHPVGACPALLIRWLCINGQWLLGVLEGREEGGCWGWLLGRTSSRCVLQRGSRERRLPHFTQHVVGRRCMMVNYKFHLICIISHTHVDTEPTLICTIIYKYRNWIKLVKVCIFSQPYFPIFVFKKFFLVCVLLFLFWNFCSSTSPPAVWPRRPVAWLLLNQSVFFHP